MKLPVPRFEIGKDLPDEQRLMRWLYYFSGTRDDDERRERNRISALRRTEFGRGYLNHYGIPA